MVTIGSISYNTIIAITGVVVAVPAIAGWVASRVTKWRAGHHAEGDNSERLWTAVFGRPAKAPYAAINGVIVDQLQTAADLKALADRVAKVEGGIEEIRGAVATLPDQQLMEDIRDALRQRNDGSHD